MRVIGDRRHWADVARKRFVLCVEIAWLSILTHSSSLLSQKQHEVKERRSDPTCAENARCDPGLQVLGGGSAGWVLCCAGMVWSLVRHASASRCTNTVDVWKNNYNGQLLGGERKVRGGVKAKPLPKSPYTPIRPHTMIWQVGI